MYLILLLYIMRRFWWQILYCSEKSLQFFCFFSQALDTISSQHETELTDARRERVDEHDQRVKMLESQIENFKQVRKNLWKKYRFLIIS